MAAENTRKVFTVYVLVPSFLNVAGTLEGCGTEGSGSDDGDRSIGAVSAPSGARCHPTAILRRACGEAEQGTQERRSWAGRDRQLMANIIDVARQTRDVTMTRSMTSLFHLLHLSPPTSPTQRPRPTQ